MDISAQNTFTSPQLIQGDKGFDISVSGTFVGTVSAQLSKDGTTNWIDIGNTTAPTVLTASPASAWFLRVGIATGGYTSGTAAVEVY